MSRRRLILLIIALVIHAIVLMLVSSLTWCLLMDPSEGWGEWVNFLAHPSSLVTEPAWWVLGTLPGLFIAATQAMFIIPVYRHGLSLQKDGRPILWSLIGVAFFAALLTAALVLAAIDLVGLIARGRGLELSEPELIALPTVPLVCSWLLWTPLLVAFARRRPHRTIPLRLIGLLLGGTIIELVIVIPIDILVRQRTGCHCSTPSFHATWFATLALLWLTGPGLLVAALSRRRKPWLEKHCANCGYSKGKAPGEQCPECGYDW